MSYSYLMLARREKACFKIIHKTLNTKSIVKDKDKELKITIHECRVTIHHPRIQFQSTNTRKHACNDQLKYPCYYHNNIKEAYIVFD